MQSDLLSKSLTKLGLGKLAIQVYIELLSNSSQKVVDLAQKFRVHRPMIYRAMTEIRELGLMSFENLEIEPPSRVVAMLRHEEIENKRLSDDLSEILPSYLNEYYATKKYSRVKTFEGKNEFIKLLNQCIDELQPEGEVLWFSEGMELYDIIDPYYFNFELASRRKKKGNKARILASFENTVSTSKQNKNELVERKVKILPKGFSSLGTIAIFGNKVVNWNTVIPRAIMIEDEVMAKTYRDIFNFFWERL
jgi:predicted transcriptional regulator